MNMWLKYSKTLIATTLLLGAGYAIALTLQRNMALQKAQAQQARQVPLPTVSVLKLNPKPIRAAFTATGVLRAYESLDMLSETDGRIIQLNFDAHQQVAAGQILAKVEANNKQSQLKIAELNYQKAKRDFERLEALYHQKNTAEVEVENARFQMLQAEQQVLQARQILDYTTIKSPIAGIITQRAVSLGKVLQVGNPIATITDISRLRLVVNIAAQDLNNITLGAIVAVHIVARPEAHHTGVVRSIGIQSTEAGTFPVEIILQNTPQSSLLAGMQAEITFQPNTERQALLIPRTALVGDKVFVMEGNKAVAKTLTLGKEYGEEVEVLGGITAGVLLVVRGQQNLSDGQVVVIQ